MTLGRIFRRDGVIQPAITSGLKMLNRRGLWKCLPPAANQSVGKSLENLNKVLSYKAIGASCIASVQKLCL